MIPKSPKNIGSTLKSPSKNVFHQSPTYNKFGTSPPKLNTNKSKNRL